MQNAILQTMRLNRIELGMQGLVPGEITKEK